MLVNAVRVAGFLIFLQMRCRLALTIGVLPSVAMVASGPLHVPRKIA